MKIEVFAAWKHDGPKPLQPRLSWSWRTKVNGRITASAHGYNRKSDAIRAAVNHGLSFIKLARPDAILIRPERIRAAIKVIE